MQFDGKRVMALVLLAASAAGVAAVPMPVAGATAQNAPREADRQRAVAAREGAPAHLKLAAFHPQRQAVEPALHLAPEADEETSPYALLLLGGGVILLASRRRRPAPWAPSPIE